MAGFISKKNRTVPFSYFSYDMVDIRDVPKLKRVFYRAASVAKRSVNAGLPLK